MSSYLLLRNNKESGPYSIEEIKGMSLKSYDLIWVVGKSAAWRYPGEVTELKSFAPAIPDQVSESIQKKTLTDLHEPDISAVKKSETSSIRPRENISKRTTQAGSVYVNLPAEKKQITVSNNRIVTDTRPEPKHYSDPAYDFTDLFKKHSSRTARISGKVLWISTIILLFGAGILTGLFISDRRKFFTIDANHPQTIPANQPAVTSKEKEILPSKNDGSLPSATNETLVLKADSAKSAEIVTARKSTAGSKKNLKNTGVKKDTVVSKTESISSIKITESTIKQNIFNKNELLYQKIKAHPEEYLNLVTGHYSTGVFGGISSFPVSVTNNSSVMLELVIVHVQYIQNNEKVYKTEILSFTNLEPGETVSLKAPKSSRGVKIATSMQVVNAHQTDPDGSN